MIVDIIASHLFPITTAGSVDTCEGINSAVERLHREFSHDIRPPCKILCYAVTAGYSSVKNDATCTHLQIYVTYSSAMIGFVFFFLFRIESVKRILSFHYS